MRGPLGGLVTEYLERVVNGRDLSAIEDLVSTEYRGSGPDWPTTIEERLEDRPATPVDDGDLPCTTH